MKEKLPFLTTDARGLILNVFIQPKSSKNMIVGRYNDAVKIKVTAPPVDGAANKMCVSYLSKLFKIPKSNIEIISGHTSRLKKVLIKYDREKDEANLYDQLLKYL